MVDLSAPSTPRRPVIGIPADHAIPQDPYFTNPRWQLNVTYVDAVYDNGGLPLIVPILPEDPAQVMDLLDGIILSGGGDIAPDRFGQEKHDKTGSISLERDDLELRIFDAAWQRDMPILGICRGIQLLNVGMGGTLIQDLPSQRPGDVEHWQKRNEIPRNEVSHPVRLAPGSLIADIYGATSIRSNSFHHQALDQLGTGLVASGWADDGIIEAVEAPDAAFLVGVQFHPEMIYDRYPEHASIFRRLVAAATAYSERKAGQAALLRS